ncbi:hypothetical protein E1265_22900 [Streptomyces sp. 8K308]|uniref:DUF6226 family protein n=1 Tax=Streptomyces sp. 8K308 TaxID=2530388 RepID=UPI0010500AE8|nr:DUF6226 family protein [Streptomyces sp. 8K308]TDC19983.1 hypothetical protein E1265_22900 [Streptomyces sp. 8K308]
MSSYVRPSLPRQVFRDASEADGRVVRLTPARGDGAPLELTFTAYPGLRVRAGVWGGFVHPVCGCDACDESAEERVEDLEQLVLAVAAGRFQEEYRAFSGTPVRYRVGTVQDGDYRAGASSAEEMSRARLAEGRRRLRALPAGWAPWPPAG